MQPFVGGTDRVIPAPFAIGYVFEGKPHDYLPDVVGTLTNGRLFIAEAVGLDHGTELLERFVTHVGVPVAAGRKTTFRIGFALSAAIIAHY